MKELAKSTMRVMKRNDILAEVAKAAGWSCWSEYQTAVIHGRVAISANVNDKPTLSSSWIETATDALYNINIR